MKGVKKVKEESRLGIRPETMKKPSEQEIKQELSLVLPPNLGLKEQTKPESQPEQKVEPQPEVKKEPEKKERKGLFSFLKPFFGFFKSEQKKEDKEESQKKKITEESRKKKITDSGIKPEIMQKIREQYTLETSPQKSTKEDTLKMPPNLGQETMKKVREYRKRYPVQKKIPRKETTIIPPPPIRYFRKK